MLKKKKDGKLSWCIWNIQTKSPYQTKTLVCMRCNLLFLIYRWRS
jgi:hypothetical protein